MATETDGEWFWFALVRVDDRLLHGQVALNWARALRPERIAIVDDALAQDELGRQVLFAAAPPGIEVWIGGVDEAVGELTRGQVTPERTLVVVRDPFMARRLFDAGVRFQRLNVGALGQAPGRERVGPQVSVSAQEWEALRYLEREGVTVTLQALPSDAAVTLARIRQPRAWRREGSERRSG